MTHTNELRLFGTDGIRGVAGEAPLDRETLSLIGQAVAAILRKKTDAPPRIIIGRDTRESGPAIEQSIAAGACALGARVESAGVITTPGVAYLAQAASFDAGVVVSASHNPYQDNGIKIFTPSGKKLDDELEREIEMLVNHGSLASSVNEVEIEPNLEYIDKYIDFLSSSFDLRLDGFRLALDCANGAASRIAPEVFSRLGAHISVLSAEPNGRNINQDCGSLHTEPLRAHVRQNSFDAGVAFDGDADRALLVDEKGNLVDGDHELLILAEYLKSRGLLKGNMVVTTVMANLGLELALAERAIEMTRTPVGDRYVLEEMLIRDASLGGEQSGHIIMPDISLAGDGIVTAIEMLKAIKTSGRSLGELASSLTKYPQILINVPVKRKPPLESSPRLQHEILELQRSMGRHGRLVVRYSGTENLARVMIEGKSQSEIEAQARRLAEVIKDELS